MRWWLVLILLVGCELTATGQAIREVQSTRGVVSSFCPFGTELRVSEMGGRSETCYNDQLDILEVGVDKLQKDIIGIKISVLGENGTLNISHIPKTDGVVIRYQIPEVSKTIGKIDTLKIYPISDIEGDVITCESYPLHVLWDYC